MKTLAVAVCYTEHEGRTPFIQFKRNHLAGYRGLPGGKFDDEDKEFLPEAACREMSEEIEHQVTFDGFYALVDEIVDRDGDLMRVMLSVCKVSVDGEVSFSVIDKDEGTIEWFTREEVEAQAEKFVPSDLEMYRRIQDGNLEGYVKSYLTVRERQRPVLERFEPVKTL